MSAYTTLFNHSKKLQKEIGRSGGMRLYAVVLIGLAVLALSEGSGKKKKKPGSSNPSNQSNFNRHPGSATSSYNPAKRWNVYIRPGSIPSSNPAGSFKIPGSATSFNPSNQSNFNRHPGSKTSSSNPSNQQQQQDNAAYETFTTKFLFEKKFQVGMRLYAVVLIGLAVLALSSICNAGKGKDSKKTQEGVQLIDVDAKDFKEAAMQWTGMQNAPPPNQTESCGSNTTAQHTSLADDASSRPSTKHPGPSYDRKGKRSKKN
uniref:Transmembrane protein n=1 Tax=Globodera rostochiensis TaxID=31243 RepID=A0A914I2P8_GLORO